MRDVIVIGGGIIGLASAYYLKKAGLELSLLEKGSPGSGASSGNAGLVVPSHALPMASGFAKKQSVLKIFNPKSVAYVEPGIRMLRWLWRFRKECSSNQLEARSRLLSSMLVQSQKEYQKLVKKLPGENFYQQKGWLNVFENKTVQKEIETEAEHLAEFGILSKRLSKEETIAAEPLLSSDIAGGLLYPGDSYIDPPLFLASLARLLSQEISSDTEVYSFKKTGDHFTILSDRGMFKAKKLVIATGAWPSLLPGSVLLAPGKGYSLTIKQPPSTVKRATYLAAGRVVATPMQDKLRFTSNLALGNFSQNISKFRIEKIRQKIQKHIPGLGPITGGEAWCGFRPCSVDGMPIIGETKENPGVCYATGHGMIGMSLGPVTGQIVADIINEKKPGFDMALLGPGRF